jgi:hypothetical protein
MCVIASAVLLILFSGSLARGQFAGSAFFSSAPTSQLGPVTNNLIIKNTANGFTVTGQVLIACPATPPTDAGVLVDWVIDRALSSSYAFSNWTTTTNLTGFSLPPPGASGTTAGSALTEFTEPSMTSPSQSLLPMTLVNGAATWASLTNTSATFSGATPASPVYYLRQHFFLDGVYQVGPGGNWVVDVPLDSFITQVPEPAASGVVALVGLSMMARRSRSARRRTVM